MVQRKKYPRRRRTVALARLLPLVLMPLAARASAGCSPLNYCNGHGTCDMTTGACTCYEGWGASTDVTLYRAADCSARACPAGKAWGDVPTSATTAHAEAECSNRGICDRTTGECACFDGFEGGACERSTCPGGCSGHGRCVNMQAMATIADALPLSNTTTYTGEDDTITWDEDKIHGCVCDSSWTVGLGPAETQEPEWFGADCSLRHCPSGDDPNTVADETDCQNKTTSSVYASATGEWGNLCHVDCSNRGTCDFSTGLCNCYTGYYGHNCNSKQTLQFRDMAVDITEGAGEGLPPHPLLEDGLILSLVLRYTSDNAFLFVGGVSRAWRASWAQSRRPSTGLSEAVTSVPRLRWAKASGCPWNSQTCSQAALAPGGLDVLRWARANGCPWNETTCLEAARCGNIGVLRWASTSGCRWDYRTCSQAALGGHLEVLQWARAEGCPWNSLTCSYAAGRGHLGVLRWARANGCPWDESTCSQAALGGHLEVLSWARQNGCPWNFITCSQAARSGNLRVLQWARANGCPWKPETICAEAAGGGHLQVLKWARVNGCPWDAMTCAQASRGGYLEVLEWARAHGCPWNCTILEAARARGHDEVVEWATANGCPDRAG